MSRVFLGGQKCEGTRSVEVLGDPLYGDSGSLWTRMKLCSSSTVQYRATQATKAFRHMRGGSFLKLTRS